MIKCDINLLISLNVILIVSIIFGDIFAIFCMISCDNFWYSRFLRMLMVIFHW